MQVLRSTRYSVALHCGVTREETEEVTVVEWLLKRQTQVQGFAAGQAAFAERQQTFTLYTSAIPLLYLPFYDLNGFFFGNIVSTECFLNGCMQLSYKVPTATIWRERCIWVRDEWSILWSEHWPLSQDKVCAELKQVTLVLFCQTGAVSACGVVDLDHSFPALPTICQPNLNHKNFITSNTQSTGYCFSSINPEWN